MTTEDILEAIDVIAEKLSVPASKLYEVLYAQAKVYAVVGCIKILFGIGVIAFTVWLSKKLFWEPVEDCCGYKVSRMNAWLDEDELRFGFFTIAEIVAVVFSLIFAVVIVVDASSVITALLNPDFWVADYILKLLA